MRKLILIAVAVVAAAAGVKAFRSIRARLDARRPGLTLTSPDVEDGGTLPDKFTLPGTGADRPTPRLHWANVPSGTQSFVVLLHDPDVSVNRTSEDATLWLAFNIPGSARGFAANLPSEATLPDGTIQINGAPDPMAYHHYTFELLALDTNLALDPNVTRAEILNASNGHILAKGILQGRYHR